MKDSMPVTKDDVEYVAQLARLFLSDDERTELTRQLNRILAYVEQLQQLEIDDVPPTKHVIDLHNVTRDDEPTASLDRERVLSNAPDSAEGYFSVPRVLPE